MREKLRTCWEQSALKAWTERKIRLSRGKKLALNLVIILLAGGWLWGLAGWPLPTLEMEFRRLERQYLAPRSEIAYQTGFWNTGDVVDVRSRDGRYLSVFQPFVVGVAEDRVYSAALYQPGRNVLTVVPLGEGPAPVPVDSVIARVPEPGGTWMTGCNLLFLQIPGETEQAELDIDTVLSGGERFVRHAQEGLCLEDGLWLFSLDPGSYPPDWYEGARYTLRLRGEDGALLLEKTGTVPEAI